MYAIQRAGAVDSAYSSQSYRPAARGRSREESTQSSLSLKVRTAEGDTVELSLDATSVRMRDSGSVLTGHGRAAYSRASQSDSVTFKATIKGDLNDQEMADIVSLIHSLGTSESSASPLSSLSVYSGAFTRAGNSTIRLYA